MLLLHATADSGEGSLDEIRTLNTYMYVILCLLGLACVFVGFGEGV